MKKLLYFCLSCLFVLTAGCSGKTGAQQTLDQAGVAPYSLTDGESYLLQSLGLEGSAQILSFRAPDDADSLEVNVYRLQDGGAWKNIGGGAVSGHADVEEGPLAGTFAMQLKEDYAIDLHINATGLASYSTGPIQMDAESVSSTKGFLRDFQKIELGEEIPVAILVYDSGTTMRSYAPADYFDPSAFDGMDLVQAVTLTFR